MKTINGETVMSTSDVSKALGFYVSMKFLESIGVKPMVSTGIGKYFRASDLPIIKHAISRYLDRC